jgi:hypothetical protein
LSKGSVLELLKCRSEDSKNSQCRFFCNADAAVSDSSEGIRERAGGNRRTST